MGAQLRNTLTNYESSFTKSERKISQYILDHMDEVIFMSVTDLSEVVGVGEATILRFCQKIGFKGYQNFKILLAKDMQDKKVHTGHERYIDVIHQNLIEVLDNTRQLIDEKSLQKAIDLILTKSSVYAFGVGSSGILAQDLSSRCVRYGKIIHPIVDGHFQCIHAATFSGDEVVIAISQTGSTFDMVNAVEVAKQRGAKIIAITNYLKSPLTYYADVVLLTSGKENPLDGGSMVAKVSQLYVIDLLCTGVALENREQSEFMKERTALAVATKIR